MEEKAAVSWMKGDTPESLIPDLRRILPELYTLEPAFLIHLLWYSENVIYKISFPFAAPRVLRIHRTGYHTEEEMAGELLWMDELSRETDIRLPRVYKGKNGRVLQHFISVKGNRYTVSMISFLEGSAVQDLSPRRLLPTIRDIGRITAEMHLESVRHLTRQDSPDPAAQAAFPKLRRMTWDQENFFGKTAVWGTWRDDASLSDQERDIFSGAEQKICRQLDLYGRTPAHYGIIHADLHVKNVIQYRGENQVIDFDDFGYGFYLYDLGCTLVTFSEGLPELVRAWDEGYESVRPLTEQERKMLPMFVLLRRMMRLAWLTSHGDSDTAKHVDPAYKGKTVEMAAAYVQETL